MKPMTTSRNELKRIAVMSVALFAAVIAYFVLVHAVTIPPAVVGMSLDDFAAKAPAFKELFLVDGQDGTNLVWIGPLNKWTVPSGPPCYVFDSNLKLVRWTNSIGEGSPVDRDYRQAQTAGRKIRLSDAVSCLSSSSTKNDAQ